MTLKEARKQFRLYIRPFCKYKDESSLNEAFNNWTDSLHKDGIITDRQYNTWTRK